MTESDARPLPTTEARLPAAANLDQLPTLELVRLIGAEDATVAAAVAAEAPRIAAAIDSIAERLASGGRLVYLGAGTSGRLGVLDASECPPTFSAPPGQVHGLIAGGRRALTEAVEGAEDDRDAAAADLAAIGFAPGDTLVGIAASGTTPYVLAGVESARRLGAFTVGLSCVAESPLAASCDLAITPVVGPEVLAGSTRMKAGTATKLVLNQLSTGTMVRLGKTFGDLMVDLRAANAKLHARSLRILRELTGLDAEAARAALDAADGRLKIAVVAVRLDLDPPAAEQQLERCGGSLRAALGAPAN